MGSWRHEDRSQWNSMSWPEHSRYMAHLVARDAPVAEEDASEHHSRAKLGTRGVAIVPPGDVHFGA